MSIYRCPVCKNKLIKIDKSYVCMNKHSFDISKKGYVNLLLANQSHSLNPGDSKEMVEARTNFLKLDYYLFLKEKLVEIVNEYIIDNGNFCDLACGEGYYTNDIHSKIKLKNCKSYGVDLSKYAIMEAGRKKRISNFDNLNYCIGNLMNLPYIDNSFDVLLNCFAPMFSDEFYRILKPKGIFIRVLPNKRHMYELKELIYEKPRENSEKEEYIKGFKLLKSIEINRVVSIDNYEDVLNLFKMTPLFYKSDLKVIENIKKIDTINLNFDFVINIYERE